MVQKAKNGAEPRCAARRGYSLIEFIGVVAVIAILASLIAPVVIKRIDFAVWQKEQSDLQTIVTNIATGITGTRTIPSRTTWANLASSNLSIAVSSVTTTPRGVSRIYLVDANGWLGTNGLSYPYVQTTNGFSQPLSARVLVVSSIDAKNGLPQNLDSTDFQTTWNWDPTLVPGKPTSPHWAAWSGNGSDVLIQRLNLQPLFHHLVLFNRDAPTTAASFSVDGSTLVSVGSTPVDAYYLDGSVLAFYTNSSSSTGLAMSEILKSDESRIFESGIWRDQISSGPPNPLQDQVDQVAYAFTTSPPTSKRTYGVADMLISYMSAYSSWANMSPCFSSMGADNNKFVPQAALMGSAQNCFNNPGTSGCQIVP